MLEFLNRYQPIGGWQRPGQQVRGANMRSRMPEPLARNGLMAPAQMQPEMPMQRPQVLPMAPQAMQQPMQPAMQQPMGQPMPVQQMQQPMPQPMQQPMQQPMMQPMQMAPQQPQAAGQYQSAKVPQLEQTPYPTYGMNAWPTS